MSIDWAAVSESLKQDCPSQAYRDATVELLTRVENLGPLVSPSRTPADEFRRVYKFIHYNEPSRLIEVADELLQGFGRAVDKAPHVRRNAWNYVVGAFDRWICRARVFYLVAGLLEGTLRSRLDARMTDWAGPLWPQHPGAIPSSVLKTRADSKAAELLAAIGRLTGNAERDSSNIVGEIRNVVQQATAPTPEVTGTVFIAELTFSQLRTFYQTGRLWTRGPGLSTVFTGVTVDRPLLIQNVRDTLQVIHDVRNAVAHYRPNGALSFSNGLFASARLAAWLGVDIQHFYGAVDIRSSTELSVLLDDRQALSGSDETTGCSANGCAVPEPFDILLTRAPISIGDLVTDLGVSRACLYHRVALRASAHHPKADAARLQE